MRHSKAEVTNSDTKVFFSRHECAAILARGPRFGVLLTSFDTAAQLEAITSGKDDFGPTMGQDAPVIFRTGHLQGPSGCQGQDATEDLSLGKVDQAIRLITEYSMNCLK